MQTRFLIAVSAVALSLALGLGASLAQAPDGPAGAAPTAPAAQPSSPGGMTGGGDSPGGMSQRGEDAPGAGPDAAAPDGPDSKQMGERTKEPGEAKDPRDRKAAGSDRKPDKKAAEREGRDARDHDSARKSAESKSDVDRKSAETGDRDRMDREGKSSDRKDATAKIDAGQKQKVRTYFSENKPRGTRIDKNDVSVSIGIGLPASIVLTPVPPDIVVVAADCPLQYFLWGDDVVLVDSCSREVVDIIPNIG